MDASRVRWVGGAGVALAFVAAAILVPLVTTGKPAPERVSIAEASSSPSAVTNSQSPSTASSPTAAPLPVGRCSLADLDLTPGVAGLGLGHANFVIRFANLGGSACRLTGYPRVLGVGAARAGLPLGHDMTSSEGATGPVVVRPGAAAEVIVSGLDNRQDGQTRCPPPYTSFVVALPGDSRTVSLSAYLPGQDAYFPSCVPAMVTSFGAMGAFSGADDRLASGTSCPTDALEVRLATMGYAMSHEGALFTLTNIGNVTCTLDGYPGLVFVSADALTLPGEIFRGSGYIYQDPGPSQVVLPPSGVASFGLTTGEGATGSGACGTSAVVEVMPPNATGPLVLSARLRICPGAGISVTAVVPGSTGSTA